MIITEPEQLGDYVDLLIQEDEIAFDTETTGVRPFEGDRICAFSLYHPNHGSIFVPVRQQGLGVVNMPESGLIHLKRLFASLPIVAGQNLSHDINFCRVEDLWEEECPIFDTMYGAFLFNDGLTSFKLKGPGGLSETLLHRPTPARDKLEEFKRSHPKITYDFIPIEILHPYAEDDVEIVWDLKEFLRAAILSRDELYERLLSDEMRWAKMVTNLSATGLLFDFERCQEIEKDHQRRIIELQDRFNKEIWPGFNSNSAPMCMNFMRQNDIDAPNTEANTMWLYTKQLPILEDVIESRMLGHALTAYLLKWKVQAHRGGGRVYASWGATGHGYGDDYGQTRTGRLRARSPNLMGVPVHDSDKKNIHREKEVFIPPKGWIYGAADISQGEVRVGSHYAQCEPLLEVLRDPDGDVHSSVAHDLGMERDRAKRVVFGGGLYGAGAPKMSQTMTDELHEFISVQQAGLWLGKFSKKYPEFKTVRKLAESVAKRRGALKLWDGRWMQLGDNDDPHKAFDWIVQGGIAAIMKQWMMKIEDYQIKHKMRGRIVLQIHDEVVWELPKEEQDALPELAALIKGIGPEGGWRCPLFVKTSIGERWSDL